MAAKTNLLAEIGNLLIQFQLEKMKAGSAIRQDSTLPATEASQLNSTGIGDNSTLPEKRQSHVLHPQK